MHLATVSRLLLLPGSTIESPNTITAGIDSLSCSFTRASVLHKIIIIIKKETRSETVEEEEVDKSIFIHYFGSLSLFCVL